jgi:hypothetical protein
VRIRNPFDLFESPITSTQSSFNFANINTADHSIMSLALKITRNPCCRQVLLPRSSTLCKVTRRNLATSHNPQLLGSSHHPTGTSALKPKPTSDVLMYSAFAAAGVGIPCAILYSVREPYSLSWTQLVTNFGVVLIEFVLPTTY